MTEIRKPVVVQLSTDVKLTLLPVPGKPYFMTETPVTNEQWNALADHPVVDVSWHDAIRYIAKLNSAKFAIGEFRLLTEAEWEHANFSSNGTTSAYKFVPNLWDFYDMHGVLCGGGWYNFAQNCRSANRNYFSPDYRDYLIGFRLVFVPNEVNQSLVQAEKMRIEFQERISALLGISAHVNVSVYDTYVELRELAKELNWGMHEDSIDERIVAWFVSPFAFGQTILFFDE